MAFYDSTIFNKMKIYHAVNNAYAPKYWEMWHSLAEKKHQARFTTCVFPLVNHSCLTSMLMPRFYCTSCRSQTRPFPTSLTTFLETSPIWHQIRLVFPLYTSPLRVFLTPKNENSYSIRYVVNLMFIGPCIILIVYKDRPTWCHLLYYFTIYCSTCFEC
jgi:hypothetical protein